MTGSSSRRDFLRGKAAIDVVGDLVRKAASDAPQPPLSQVDEAYLIRVGRPAMGSTFEVYLNAGQYARGTEAALAGLDRVETLEDQMSVFRPTSQLSLLNRQAADAPVRVEQPLFDLLEQALELSSTTGGAFDITTSPLWRAWGFAQRAGNMPSERERAEAMACVGSHLVDLDREQGTVRFLKPGVEINLGSIGKGFALDRCAEHLEEAGICDFLLHGGQSSLLARGARGVPTGKTTVADSPEGGAPTSGSSGWSVGVRHPLRRAKRLAEIHLFDRALATSGTGTQCFEHGGKRYGHILDPRTGQPAERVFSATVVAPTAAQADALATAFCVMKPDEAVAYCQDRPELAILLIGEGCGGADIEVLSAGFDEHELSMLEP